VLTEPALSRRLAAGGRQIAAQLGWGELAKRMESLYGHLVGDDSRVS
jgi:hypothetical protein